jgi:hypothetical protein
MGAQGVSTLSMAETTRSLRGETLLKESHRATRRCVASLSSSLGGTRRGHEDPSDPGAAADLLFPSRKALGADLQTCSGWHRPGCGGSVGASSARGVQPAPRPRCGTVGCRLVAALDLDGSVGVSGGGGRPNRISRRSRARTDTVHQSCVVGQRERPGRGSQSSRLRAEQ